MDTETFVERDGSLSQDALDRLAAYLRGGELVALPTETVYGLGARADLPAALEALRNLKGRQESHVFTVHLADREAIEGSVNISPLAERLMRRYWPGPLTLVLLDRRGEWTGFRVPAKETTREVLRRVGAPVVLSSANPTKEKPACDAESVLRYFPRGLRAVLDGGPCALSESSTVLKLEASGPKILRQGIVTLEDARRTMGKRVLFLCTGNTCRSPLAEGLLKKRLGERFGLNAKDLGNFGFVVTSAGLVAGFGSPASPMSLQAARESGVDLTKHRSRGVEIRMLQDADFVFAMSQSHLDRIHDLAPDLAARVRRLDAQGNDIPDPFGGSLAEYRACREAISRGIEKILPEL